jgi:hypothetical protein
MRNLADSEGDDFLANEIDDLRDADGTHVIAPATAFQTNVVVPNNSTTNRIHPIAPAAIQQSDTIPINNSNSNNQVHRPYKKLLHHASNELQVFHNNSQNVHAPQVERSVTQSLNSLCFKYFTVTKFSDRWISVYSDVLDAISKEINNYISNSTRKDKEQVKKGYHFIRNVSYSHSSTYLSLNQILCLLWMAASDTTAPCPQNPYIDCHALVQLRKEAILDRVVEAETTYDHGRSCSGGYVNNLVASLSQAHECVNVLLVESGTMSAATDSLNFWILEKIKKLPYEIQKDIFCSWDDLDEGSDCEAYRFHSNKPYIQEMLSKLEMNYRLSETQKRQINDAWYSLPRPAMHPELNRLLDKILSVYVPGGITHLLQFDQTFQLFGKTIIRESSSFQSAYNKLKVEYEIYQEIRESLAFLDNFSDYLSNSRSLEALKSTISNLNYTNSIAETKDKILIKIDAIKREIKQIFQNNIRISPLKNAFMIFVPIIGWTVLLYRYFTKKTAFFPIPSSKQIFLLWCNT